MTTFIAALPLLFGSVASSAQATMDYEFTVCGVKHRFADRKIDWTFNPTYNGYREWPWQFARMRFLPDLAKYYGRTGDEKAAKTFVDIVSSFIDEAPPPPPGTRHGATKSWRTLDTGLRATSWVNSYFAFTDSPALTPEFRAKFRRSIDDHVRRLEKPMTSNNWRIMELRGLVDLLLAFPDVERADEILAGAERELAEALEKQLYPDGFHFELSTGYHGVLDGDYARLAMRYRKFGRTPPPFLESGIELAFELYPRLTRPDRFLPKLNDSGRMPVTGRMKTASGLFPGRSDFRWFATDGKEGAPPPYLSYAFPYSGAVVFRSSWDRDAVWGYVDCSPFGRGHQHEDKLNFLLFAYGKEMLTEGGNYAYDTSEMRKYVISTRAHNTVRIDGKDQSARKFWKWSDDMLHKKADFAFSTNSALDRVSSTFPFGYGAGKNWDGAVKHTRTVEFVKDDPAGPFFRITDELTATDDRERAYEQLWHLEKCALDMADDRFTADFGDGVTLEASFSSDNGRLVDQIGTKEPQLQGWLPVLPAGPHEHRPIHTPTLKGTFARSAKIVSEFRPRRDIRKAPSVDPAKVSFLQSEYSRKKPFDKIAEVATNAMDGRITTVGTRHAYDPERIDWKFNPVYNGYREYVWQLGRMYFLNDVAAYYLKTKDPRAARFWVNCISSWIGQADYDEPRETGFDGTCWRSLDAAIRLEGWTAQFPVFKDDPAVTDEFIALFLDSVKLHGEHLMRYNTSRNWLIYELTGLLRAAVVFPFVKGAAEWKRFALAKLESELVRQLYPDGFHYELSSGYHSVIPTNYGTIYDFLVRMGEPAPGFLENGLEKSFDLYVKLCRPDGRLPALNDAGEAQVSRKMVNASRFYPGRDDFRWFATGGESGAVPGYTSVALEYSGSVVMRTGWGPKDIWAYMDCGPVGRGHQHEDKLNVLLWAYGKEMLTEGGIYVYDTSEMRQYVLVTSSHNTARIGGKNQNRRVGYVWRDEDLHKKAPFGYGFGKDVEWCSADYVEGYGDKRELKARHGRKMVFHKTVPGLKPFFAVIDRFSSDDGESHGYEIMWHLETCRYGQSDRRFSADFGDGAVLDGFASADVFTDKIGRKKPYFQGWKPVFKEGPHEHRPIHTPVLCGEFKGAKRLVTVLYPREGAECPVAGVKASTDPSDASYSVILADGTEIPFTEPGPGPEDDKRKRQRGKEPVE